MAQSHLIPAAGYMRLSEILKVFPVSKSSWWANVKRGIYPSPVKLGPRITAWRVEDIRALLANPINYKEAQLN